MIKRLLNYSPKEMLALTSEELFFAIKMSEGRVVEGMARSRGPNYLQHVTNAEVCAAFGCDIVHLDCINPQKLIFPGLPSKNPEDDKIFSEIQVPVGRGWIPREIRNIIGRPISMALMIEQESGIVESKALSSAGWALATDENIDIALNLGFDILGIHGWAMPEQFLSVIEKVVQKAHGKVLIEAGIPYGPGRVHGSQGPHNLRDMFEAEFAANMVKAGAQIIQIPAVGSLPGFTSQHVGTMIDAVHAQGGLCSIGIHSSQGSTDISTIRRIGIDNKALGADIQLMGSTGMNENVALPELIRALCIAIKGQRHTYRRTAESVAR